MRPVVSSVAVVALVCIAAAQRADSVEIRGYGIIIEAYDGALFVADVRPGSPAAKAGLSVGARVVRVNDIPVERLDQVRRVLARGGPVDLTVEDPDGDRRARPAAHRLSFLAVGHAWTGQASSLSGYFGVGYGFQAAPRLWLLVSAGYVPVGREPFVDGRNASSLLAGAELEVRLAGAWFGFVRGLGGVTIPWSAGSGAITIGGPAVARWRVEPITVLLHAGARIAGFELYLAGGHGPAEGINVGLGLGFELSFGER